jgi:capsid protein
MPKKRKPTPSLRTLREQAEAQQLALAMAETKYATTMLQRLEMQENRFAIQDQDEMNWMQVSSGNQLVDAKDLGEISSRDPRMLRRQAYRMWRTNPHARGIIRNFEKFIIGKEFELDFADEIKGKWNEERTQLEVTTGEDDPPLLYELWEDFADRNSFTNLAKEMVRRSFRDGGAFIRRFTHRGFTLLRFIEPERVMGPPGALEGEVKLEDLTDDHKRLYGEDGGDLVGKPTLIRDGIEFLKEDPVFVVAYHVQRLPNDPKPERVPAKEVIHTKPFADANDPRGFFLLEVIMRHLNYYAQWEEYRLVLNKFRSAIVLVRKIQGTATQARTLIDGRASPHPSPTGRVPQTSSGNREAMPASGTILSAGVGVDYEFKTPNLQAADAEHDGRRFLLSASAGTGLPEGMVTADWSNNNYASSVESRTPAVREWEDWQEFFEAPIKQIVRWVIEAGIETLGVPEDVDKTVTIQWPPLVTKDAEKETNRNVILQEKGLLSDQTWSAREGLDYEEEQENLRSRREEQGLDPTEPGPTIPPTPEEEAAAALAAAAAAAGRPPREPGVPRP